ncbi:alpha-1,2-fucosyltransferase [Polynucleobacter sp. 30F-ANTBAC]|uniref:alpha-1,2-fucosyltransferase n=1 Tax=Polynucleobacter sp. 30F-ANTBAC TaxID=2689095 RepID=UPI001C0C2BE9|nr:alpha-1,2-fucosyltransferase [Polynucleobacter sp. 30F-ANTBAC]MBU3599658.1 alpha-1,2-fucosyltransferase [Polynucleobacter sp. 30F-ANTBAC]
MKNKIIIRLIGGLGNQMFQYAAARALADELDFDLLLDLRLFDNYKVHKYGLNKFRITAKIADKNDLIWWPHIMRRPYEFLSMIGLPCRWYREKKKDVKHLSEINRSCLLDGYFQSEVYFQSVYEKLKLEFIPQNKLSEKNLKILDKIKEHESVMVHIRRGDYLSSPQNMIIHGLCDIGYYETAYSLINNKINNPYFFIFSDDLNWARDNILFGDNVTFVSGNDKYPEVDIYLMSQCKHHIIANSTFSWWGAWLSNNKNKIVIAPKKWFASTEVSSDYIVPDRWLRI